MCQNTLIAIPRIATRFALPQSYTIFVYRGACAPLLYSYCGVSTRHITTFVQAQVVNDLLTLESILQRKAPFREFSWVRWQATMFWQTYIQIILVFSLCSGVPQTRMKFAKGRFSFLIFIMMQLNSG